MHQRGKRWHFRYTVVCFLLIVTLVCMAFMCTGCFGMLQNNSSSQDKALDLEISDITMSVEYNEYLGYTAIVKGTAKNIKRDYSYASVEFVVYDEDGNNMGTALDNINYLLKGDTWQFEAHLFTYSKARPKSCKLVDITTINK